MAGRAWRGGRAPGRRRCSRWPATAASTTGSTELATARQYGLDAKLLLVDDGGYGVLREYQEGAYGETHAVDLVQPDFVAVCDAFGVPVRASSPESLAADLAWAFATEGPAVVVLKTPVRWIQP